MIYIAFTKEEFIRASELVTSEDIILAYTDCIDTHKGCNSFDVSDIQVNWAEQVALVRDFFKVLSEDKKLDLNGYANNFFECSIRLSVQYIESLKFYSSHHHKVIFADKLFGNGKPNYYLSEHESQGQLMYNRKSALQNSIVQVVKSLGLEIEYLGHKFNHQRLSNALRDTAVFSNRFLKALISSVKKQPDTRIRTLEKSQFYVVLRTQAQFSAIKQILETPTNTVTIICSSTFIQNDLFNSVQQWAESLNFIQVINLPEAKIGLIIKTYLKTLKSSVSSFNKLLYGNGFKIDVKQACREVIIMSAELELYRNRLENILPLAEDNNIFLTCEQKSPHAYTEINLAILKGYKTIQIMACDQEAIDLPIPAVADVYLTDTLKRKNLFESRWSTKISNLKYLGPIRQNVSKFINSTAINEFDVCYFAHVTEINHNKEIISLLEKLKLQSSSFRYCIKLHPRDSGAWLREVPISKKIIYTSSHITNEELYNKFKVAISNPSAVVMELLCHFKPFIFIDIIESYKHVDFVSCDEEYPGYTKTIDAIPELLSAKYDLNKEVRCLHSRVFGNTEKVVCKSDLVSVF